MKIRAAFCVLLTTFMLFFHVLYAQHEHHVTPDAPSDSMNMHHDSVGHHAEGSAMSHAYSINLLMNRNGSGTAWMPDFTPMYGYMFHSGKWMYMVHGNVFFRYNKQDVFKKGRRGGEEFDVVNWFMFMGQRRISDKGLFHFSTMLSFDRFFGGDGYPLLFQTGESWKGQPLVDRQHPHDLFSEISLSYSHAVNKRIDLFVYAGYPGEPALGSVAFMHRVSSLYGPDAPLSHHWNDGTHITFGVLTGGIRIGKFKLEGSSYTGREPDENRYDFDKPRFDSYSGRLSFNPDPYWSFHVSHGFNKSPELLHPGDDVIRTVASGIYSRPIGAQRTLNMTALWAMNKSHGPEHAVLAEGAIVLNRVAVYSRYEWIQKSAEELALDEAAFFGSSLFPVNALTLGISYDVIRSKGGNAAIGAQGTCYAADQRLNHLYGKDPLSAEVFIRLYPPRMR